MRNKKTVLSGVDVLEAEGFKSLKKKRVALLVNQASVNKNCCHLLDIAKKYGCEITKIFAPEHGLFGVLQDMESVGHTRESRYGIEVISLYGTSKDSLQLDPDELENVDILLCDLQDVGSRYYTYHCTISWAMKACAKKGVAMWVIDRPNPINAVTFEGNRIDSSCYSFVGAYPLLNRHGFTMAEIVNFVAKNSQPDVSLKLVQMKNYERHLEFEDIDLPFIAPSPNMPTVNAARLYPGMCLLEGTNLSEGRGTCFPFSVCGAPFINDAYAFKTYVESFNLPGVHCRVASFVPKFQKHANQECFGLAFNVYDVKLFQPLRFACAVIFAASQFDGFCWRQEAYEFEHERLAIDLLLGQTNLKDKLTSKDGVLQLFNYFSREESKYKDIREEYLLY